jgi:hypothetical protein
MTDSTPRPDTPDRASIAGETNGHIRALARSFHDEREVGFFCECGCMGLVFATIAEYDEQGGVFIEGHETRLETTGGS